MSQATTTPSRPVDGTPARLPDVTGQAERDGVRLAYAVYGDAPRDGRLTLVLLPTWQIITSRCWKAQIGYLARYYRVVTFDARGSGGSDRPEGAAAYADAECAANASSGFDRRSWSWRQAQAVARQHTLDGCLNGESRVLLLHNVERDSLKRPHIARVAVINLVAELLASDNNLVGVGYNDEVAHIHVRAEGRLVLAAQHSRH